MDPSFLENTFTITTQPKQNFHFRYASELSSTHGILSGQQPQQHLSLKPSQNNNSEETYPTIRLQLPANGHLDDCGNKRDFYVLCSLHSYYNNKPHSLSPHLLMKKGQIRLEYDFMFPRMDVNPNDALERIWSLKDYVIVRLKASEYPKALQEKQRHFQSLGLPMDFELIKGDVNIDDKESLKKVGILNVCLGFTIFERDFYTNTYRLYKETIYSDNIFHGDDLKIHELCNIKGGITGNTKVTLLIKLQPGYTYSVHMYRYQNNSTTISWEEFIPVRTENIFSNAAITFTLPEGPPDRKTDEIEVMLEVVVGRSTYKSPNVRFWYMNNTEDVMRRKIPRMAHSSPQSVSSSDETTGSTVWSAINSPRQSTDSSTATQMLRGDATNPNANSNQNYSSSMNVGDEDPLSPLEAISPYDMHYSFSESGISFAPLILDDVAIPYMDLHTPPDELDVYVSRDRVARKEDNIPKTARNVRERKISIDAHACLKDRIAHILELKKDAKNMHITGIDNKIGNTIFHEAIMDPSSLLLLYRQMKTTAHKELVLEARNNFRQNLLHHACSQNKPACIRPLIGMGCRLYEQDWQGRTPLHTAIEHNNTTCIAKFQDLLANHSQYEKGVEGQLIDMFKVYDHRGHTVLHAALLKNLSELVKVMLKFCKLHKVDILQYEVLGNGDSIVHIIVKEDLLDMIEVIKEYVPNYLRIQNYPGQTVLDIPDLSLKMFDALSIKCT